MVLVFWSVSLLTYFSWILILYGNQSVDLHSKSLGWFLYHRNTGLAWVKYYRCRLLIDQFTDLRCQYDGFYIIAALV